MQKANALLFELIRYELLSSPISESVRKQLKDNDCFKEVAGLAKKHDMITLAADALITSGIMDKTAEDYNEISKLLVMSVYRYNQIEYTSKSIFELFEKNAIDFIPLKGAETRKYYPKPWMRTSCDADILVKKEQVDSAIALLTEKLGGKPEWSSPHDVPIKFANGVNVELHFTLKEKWFKSSAVLEKVWDYVTLREGMKHCYRLSDEMFYFYHIYHMAKHFKNGGCGIKPFVDTYLINRHLKVNEQCDELLREAGLEKFEKYAVRLSNAWMTGTEDKELDDMEKYVLSGGVYGHQNTVNGKNASEEIFRIDRVFVSFGELKYKYKALEKHPWLYPFFAVVRVFRLLFCTLPFVIKTRIKNHDKAKKEKVTSIFNKIDL